MKSRAIEASGLRRILRPLPDLACDFMLTKRSLPLAISASDLRVTQVKSEQLDLSNSSMTMTYCCSYGLT